MTATEAPKGAVVAQSRPQESPIQQLIAKHERAIVDALSATPLKVTEFMIALRSAAIAEPLINDCIRDDPGSVLGCIMEAAQRGLRPGRVFGHFAMIPRKVNYQEDGKWKHYMSLTSIVEYRGLMFLAERCNAIEEMHAQVIYKGEPFSYDHKTREIEHNPFDLNDTIERNEETAIGAYAVVRIKGRARPCVVVLRRMDIERIRAKSDSYKGAIKYKNDKSPWITDWTEMWKKTALRKALNSGEVPIAGSVAEEVRDEPEAEIVRPATVVDAPAPTARISLVPAEPAEAEPEKAKPTVADFEISVGSPTMAEGRYWVDSFNGEIRVCRSEMWEQATQQDIDELRALLLAELKTPPPPELMSGELAQLVVQQRRKLRGE